MKTAAAVALPSSIPSITSIIDQKINATKIELARLEQIKVLASGAEPEVTTAPRKRGRPRKGTAAASNQPKRPRGRPKGSKNKPKTEQTPAPVIAEASPTLSEL